MARPKSSCRLSKVQYATCKIQTTVACVCPVIKVHMSIISPVHTSTILVSQEANLDQLSRLVAGKYQQFVCSNLLGSCLPAFADKTNYMRNSDGNQLFWLSCSTIAQHPIQPVSSIAGSKGSRLDHWNHIASAFDVTNCLVNHHRAFVHLIWVDVQVYFHKTVF